MTEQQADMMLSLLTEIRDMLRSNPQPVAPQRPTPSKPTKASLKAQRLAEAQSLLIRSFPSIASYLPKR